MRTFLKISVALMLSSVMLFGCKPEDDPNNGGNNGGNSGGIQPLTTETIDGVYSVDSFTVVYFSQGNLQYQAYTNTWRFAGRQWECCGDDNSNISSTYDGWIDLFGWGTSGHKHGAVCYQPWSISDTLSHFWAYGKGKYDLCDSTRRADWGYNAIINGGNVHNVWRTLSDKEWDFILNTRTTLSGIRYAKVKLTEVDGAGVDGVNGLVLLPDDWKTEYYPLNETNTYNANYVSNTITVSQWSTLEEHGAVFLPAAGHREGTLLRVGFGNYWTTTHTYTTGAKGLYFSKLYVAPSYFNNRNLGASVRLVRSFK